MLAARRAGIRKVILPKENARDLNELPESIRGEMTFVLAERVSDVLEAAIPGVHNARKAKAAMEREERLAKT